MKIAYLFRIEPTSSKYPVHYALVYAENEEAARETAKQECKEVNAKSRLVKPVYKKLTLMTFGL